LCFQSIVAVHQHFLDPQQPLALGVRLKDRLDGAALVPGNLLNKGCKGGRRGVTARDEAGWVRAGDEAGWVREEEANVGGRAL
jgi:hypothetical protein